MIDIGKEIETIKKSFFNATIAKIKSLVRELLVKVQLVVVQLERLL